MLLYWQLCQSHIWSQVNYEPFFNDPQPNHLRSYNCTIDTLQPAVFNLYPNKNWKWNCSGANIQLFWSEIIQFQENGSRGHHFGQSLNLPFLKGLTHSAMWRKVTNYICCFSQISPNHYLGRKVYASPNARDKMVLFADLIFVISFTWAGFSDPKLNCKS